MGLHAQSATVGGIPVLAYSSGIPYISGQPAVGPETLGTSHSGTINWFQRQQYTPGALQDVRQWENM
jgi:hypothetical protein